MSIRQPQTLRRASLVLGIAALAVGGAACGSSDSNMSDATTSVSAAKVAATPNQVRIKLIAYRPDALTAKVGATVTWKQTDPGFHTITSGTVAQGSGGVTPQPDGAFASGQLATGKTFSHPFTEPGTYPYFCEIHPATMRGTITVP